MKTVHTEENLIREIQDQIRDESSTDISTFNLAHPVRCFLRKKNGESSSHSYYILDVNTHGILAVLTSTAPKEYQFFNFSDLQGIKRKRGLLGFLLTLQFKNGTRYVFQIGKKNRRFFPNQMENTDYLFSILDEQNLTLMKNNLLGRQVMTNRVYTMLYIVTFVPMFFLLEYFISDKINHIFLIVLLAIFIAIVHFILFIMIILMVDVLHRKKDRDFSIEYNQALNAYEETKNIEEFLKNLNEISYTPKTRDTKNYYYLSMSTALYRNNRTKEALAYLDKIQAQDIKMQKAVETQRKFIEEL